MFFFLPSKTTFEKGCVEDKKNCNILGPMFTIYRLGPHTPPTIILEYSRIEYRIEEKRTTRTF